MDVTLICSLQRTLHDTVQPLISGTEDAALLDFPNYSNVGDSAIWLGQLAFLRAMGIHRLRYVCDISSYSKQQLVKKIGGGIILLQGGGNFGDLWPVHQTFREQIIQDFPNNRIIQFPQTIYFREKTALDRARNVFDQHPDLTLLVRDLRSLEIARNEFKARSLLCPDMAFYLGPLPRPGVSAYNILWLARSDKEAAPESRSHVANSEIIKVDWLEGKPATGFSELLHQILVRYPRRLSPFQILFQRTYHSMACGQLKRGTHLLNQGRVVITDRLHAHILCMLLGIPHYLLDNNYGKVKNFYETWTRTSQLAHWCDSQGEALSLAQSRNVGGSF